MGHRHLILGALLIPALASLSGCFEILEELSDWKPEDVESGTYRVQLRTRQDSCDPPRLVGEVGEVDVFTDEAQLAPMVPEGAAGFAPVLQRYPLLAEDGYVATYGEGVNQGVGCGGDAKMVTRFEVLEADDDSFVLRSRIDWLVAHPCQDGEVPTRVPVQSCHVEQDLRYSRVN